MSRSIAPDSTSQSTIIRVYNASTGVVENAMTSATAGLSLSYRREGGSNVTITPSDLAAVNSAWSAGGLKLIGNGYYRLDVADAAFAAGADGVLIHGTATGLQIEGAYHQLVAASGLDAAGVRTAIGLANANLDTQLIGIKPIRTGTAQAGAAGSITLDASASATSDLYTGARVYITGGMGAGQDRLITAYNGATKVANIDTSWITTPDNTSTFAVKGNGSVYRNGSNYGLVDIQSVQGQIANAVYLSQLAADYNAGTLTASVTSVDGAVQSIAANGITSASFADGAITDAKITFPAETSGRATTFLAAMRRVWEWTVNKRIRNRATGAVQLRNAADTADLETQTQTTTGAVGSEVDTQTKGV